MPKKLIINIIQDAPVSLYSGEREYMGEIREMSELVNVCCQIKDKHLSDCYLLTKEGTRIVIEATGYIDNGSLHLIFPRLTERINYLEK